MIETSVWTPDGRGKKCECPRVSETLHHSHCTCLQSNTGLTAVLITVTRGASIFTLSTQRTQSTQAVMAHRIKWFKGGQTLIAIQKLFAVRQRWRWNTRVWAPPILEFKSIMKEGTVLWKHNKFHAWLIIFCEFFWQCHCPMKIDHHGFFFLIR